MIRAQRGSVARAVSTLALAVGAIGAPSACLPSSDGNSSGTDSPDDASAADASPPGAAGAPRVDASSDDAWCADGSLATDAPPADAPPADAPPADALPVDAPLATDAPPADAPAADASPADASCADGSPADVWLAEASPVDVDASPSPDANASGLDVSTLQPGMLAAIAPGDVAFPANNLSAWSSDVQGVYVGPADSGAGALATSGPQTIRFTTAGGKPENGATVWLAAFSDDSYGGVGEATATDPTLGYGINDTLQSNRVPIGTVLDDSLYDTQKTCVVEFAPANAESTAPPLPADEIFQGDSYTFPNDSAYLSLGLESSMNQTYASFKSGESYVIGWELLDVPAVTGGFFFLVSATDSSRTEGWNLFYDAGTYYFNVVASGNAGSGTVTLSFPASGVGEDAVAVTITNGTLRLSRRGGQIETAAIGTPVAPTAASTLELGGPVAGYHGWTGQGLTYVAKVEGVLADEELQSYSQQAQPVAPTNRWFPATGPHYTGDYSTIRGDVQWVWAASQNGSVAAAPDNTALFRFTDNGSADAGYPTPNSRSEEWYRDPRAYMVDTVVPFRNSRGKMESSALARLQPLYTTAAVGEIGIGQVNDDYFNDHAELVIGMGTAAPVPASSVVRSDGVPAYNWFAQNGSTTGVQSVAVWNGVELQRGGFALPGASLDSFVGPVGIAPGVSDVAKRLVLVASTDAVPDDLQSDNDHEPQVDGLIPQLRGDFPTTGTGAVTVVGGTVAQVSVMYASGGNSFKPWAAQIAQAAAEGEPSKVIVLVGLGLSFEAWRATGPFATTPATFATQFGELVDALHAQVKAGSVLFYTVKSIQSAWTGKDVDLSGYTLSDFDAGIDSVVSARSSWLGEIDPRSPTDFAAADFNGGFGSGWNGGNGISTTHAGATLLFNNIKAALGSNY